MCVKIKPYLEMHYEKTVDWLNSQEIRNSFGNTKTITLSSHRTWMRTNEDIIMWAIYYNDLYVGNILFNVDLNHMSAFFQIYIGENIKGKGIGKTATWLALDNLFLTTRINRVWLKVFESNNRAIKLYESIGFTKEGIERESHYDNGLYRNQVIYSYLRRDWRTGE